MNAFVSITKRKNGRMNLQITKQTYEGREIPIYSVKDSKNSKIFKEDCCLTYVKHQLHVELRKMWVILLFLIGDDWISPIIVSKVVCI